MSCALAPSQEVLHYLKNHPDVAQEALQSTAFAAQPGVPARASSGSSASRAVPPTVRALVCCVCACAVGSHLSCPYALIFFSLHACARSNAAASHRAQADCTSSPRPRPRACATSQVRSSGAATPCFGTAGSVGQPVRFVVARWSVALLSPGLTAACRRCLGVAVQCLCAIALWVHSGSRSKCERIVTLNLFGMPMRRHNIVTHAQRRESTEAALNVDATPTLQPITTETTRPNQAPSSR